MIFKKNDRNIRIKYRGYYQFLLLKSYYEVYSRGTHYVYIYFKQKFFIL